MPLITVHVHKFPHFDYFDNYFNTLLSVFQTFYKNTFSCKSRTSKSKKNSDKNCFWKGVQEGKIFLKIHM